MMTRPTALLGVVMLGIACGADRLVVSEDQLIAPTLLDFKAVPVGLSVALPVTLTNLGARPIFVSSVSFDAAAFSGPQKTLVVPAGESIAPLFSFSPTKVGELGGFAVLSTSAGLVTVSLRGQGVPREVCEPCSSPPKRFCATAQTLITYEAAGDCIEGGCQFKAASHICSGACDEATRACVEADAGRRDAGVFSSGGFDAGMPRGDAGSPVADAGPADTGPHGHFDMFDGGEYTWEPPAGVTKARFHGCGAGGAGGSVSGATGGGAACGEANFPVVPGRVVRIRVGVGGQQPGNGGGATSLYFTNSGNLEDFILGGGGGGGNGCAGCAGHFGGKGGAAGDERGQDGEVYFGSGSVCSTARGGLGGREEGGPIYGTGGLGGELPGGTGGLRCAGGFGSRLHGGPSKTVNGSVCDVNSGAFMWMEGGSEPGGGGGGGAGAFGGGGGGFVKDLCGGGGGGGSSVLIGPSAIIYRGDGPTPGFFSFGRPGAGTGGQPALDASSSFKGADGYVLIEW